MLAAPPRVDRVATIGRRLEECSAADLEAAFGALEEDAASVLAGGGWTAGLPPPERLVDARCAGQGAHMPVPLPPTPWPTQDAAVRDLITTAFRAAYLDRYHRPPPAVPIELVHARIVLRGARGTTSLRAAVGTSASAAPESRSIVIEGRRHDAAVFARAALPVGFGARGPALVQEAGSTLVVGPEGCFRVLDSGNILVEIG
jgi:N-methylhydantoinase A